MKPEKIESILIESPEDAGIITAVLIDDGAWFEVDYNETSVLYKISFEANKGYKAIITSLNVTIWYEA